MKPENRLPFSSSYSTSPTNEDWHSAQHICPCFLRGETVGWHSRSPSPGSVFPQQGYFSTTSLPFTDRQCLPDNNKSFLFLQITVILCSTHQREVVKCCYGKE